MVYFNCCKTKQNNIKKLLLTRFPQFEIYRLNKERERKFKLFYQFSAEECKLESKWN